MILETKMVFRILVTLLILVNSSLGFAKEFLEPCDFVACGKFDVESAFHQKVRCLDFAHRDPESANLLDVKTCTLHVSRMEKNKRVHYLVRSSIKHCELKKGDVVEMRIRDGGVDQSAGMISNPCPPSSLGIIQKEDNPRPKEVDSEETYVNVDFYGVCTERRCLTPKQLKHAEPIK